MLLIVDLTNEEIEVLKTYLEVAYNIDDDPYFYKIGESLKKKIFDKL